MIVSKKSIGLIVLFLIPRFAIGQNSVDSIVAKQDSSMAVWQLELTRYAAAGLCVIVIRFNKTVAYSNIDYLLLTKAKR